MIPCTDFIQHTVGRTTIVLTSIWLASLAWPTLPREAGGYLWAEEEPASVRPATGANDGQTETDEVPDSLRLFPSQISLPLTGSSQHFVVMASYGRGFGRDVTRQSQLRVSDPSLAVIEPSGRLRLLGSGKLILQARLGDRPAQAQIRILPTADKKIAAFVPEVVGLLTKHGCNRGDCHGGVKGRGGFKLSLNGLNPDLDYQSILEGGTYQVLEPEPTPPLESRIDLDKPAASLLLSKPILTVPHAGGRLFEANSADHRSILEWIQQGAPYGEPSQRFEQVELFPAANTLDPREKHQLLVTAQLENGAVRDLTEEARYEVQNPDIVQVSPEGLATARQVGETVVLARAAGRTLSTRIRVLASRISDYPELARHNFIDEHVFETLEKFHILPSRLSSDEEFLRRVCLDVTGTLPPPQRVREFLADTDPKKRERLIETLLGSPEYLDYWTFRFSEFFRVIYQDALSYGAWIRESLALNRPYDEMARQRITAQGSSGPTRHYKRPAFHAVVPAHELMSEDARVFLGVRLDCAQCHDHPFEAWSQDQFWGLAAFYGQLTRTQTPLLHFDDPAGNGERIAGPKVMHPRRKEEVQPRFLTGVVSTQKESSPPRMRLARWVTSPGNPYFARATVNRIWAHFFHRGLVEPVNGFSTANPPTDPALLEALARDFEQSGYDVQHLMRRILQSRTYQLSSVWNETNRDDELHYSRALPRRLDAEVLLDAISRVTGVNEEFVVHDYVGGGVEPAGTRAIELVPEVSLSLFLEVY